MASIRGHTGICLLRRNFHNYLRLYFKEHKVLQNFYSIHLFSKDKSVPSSSDSCNPRVTSYSSKRFYSCFWNTHRNNHLRDSSGYPLNPFSLCIENSLYFKRFLGLPFRMFTDNGGHSRDTPDFQNKVAIDLKEDNDLKTFIQSGLLYKDLYSSCLSSSSSKTPRMLTEDEFNIEEWRVLGTNINHYLYSSNEDLSSSTSSETKSIDLDRARRIYHLYIPLIKWCKANVLIHQNRAVDQQSINEKKRNQALVIGIHAPQGCGKTTLCDVLVHFLAEDDFNIASLSIDDFYHTHEKQREVSQKNSDNALLQCRGNAGTHDIELGERILQTLKYSTAINRCKLPRYDKSKFGGQGDRAQENTWPEIQTPVDLVLLEGWMLGFQHLPELPDDRNPNIDLVNESMREYERWHDLIDAWITIKVANIDQVYQWRMEAERKMIASGKDGMTEEQVMDFVGRYMPAYQTYLPMLYEQQWREKETGAILPQISFTVEDNRLPSIDRGK